MRWLTIRHSPGCGKGPAGQANCVDRLPVILELEDRLVWLGEVEGGPTALFC